MDELLRTPTADSDDRRERLALLASRAFDVLVVGGGITGAAVAHRAACEGLSVALVERGDFAGGTSGRSSRLIHGGLRYLKHLRLSLVHDSLREQRSLARLAPHLVRPLRMLLPLYGRTLPSRCGHRLGMAVYAAMQAGARGRRANLRAASELAREEPLLGAEGLQGGYVCREYLTHDARLVWETVLAAAESGACAVNYARVEELLTARGRVCGAAVRDLVTGRTHEVSARVVVNASGPWSDRLAPGQAAGVRPLRLTKGVHVFLPRRRLPLACAVAFRARRDGRHMVVIPFDNLLLVGPTETEYRGRPDDARPEPEDVDYLLDSLGAAFDGADFRAADVLAARAGLRPLYDDGSRAAGQVSRSYRVEWQQDGLLSIVGGKLTLHRRAARDALRLISRRLGPVRASTRARPQATRADSTARTSATARTGSAERTAWADAPLPGAAWDCQPERLAEDLREAGLAEDSAAHLLETYGARAALFLPLLAEGPGLRLKLLPALPHVRAEAVFAARHEMAVSAEDFTERRTDLALLALAEGVTLPSWPWPPAPATREPAYAAAATAPDGGVFK